MPGTRFNLTITSSGAVQIGEATVWENALAWGDFPTEGLRQGDRVFVTDLGQPSSYGIAQYNGEDWELTQGFFTSEIDLNEFTHPKSLGAVAYVLDLEEGEEDPQDGSGRIYFYDGEFWVRTPKNTGYVHPQVNDVAELLAISDPKETDRVLVLDTGFETYGWASFLGGQWRLDQGAFLTFENMQAFISDPDSGAVKDEAIVSLGGSGAQYAHYVYLESENEWVRTPEGTKYVHPDEEHWEDLDDIQDPKDGDQVAVTSIATGTSNGVAKWSDADSIWKLFRADFGSFTDMVNFNESVWPNAIASSDDGAKNAPWYMYSVDDESWLRLPDETGYVYNFSGPVSQEGLSFIADPKETDRVAYDTGYGTVGWAVYESGNWYLEQGTFPTVANMTSFLSDPSAIDVKVGATASVPAVDGATDAEHIHYVYVATPTPAWVRTPLDTHYIWPQVTNWAALSTRSYAVENDEVHVQSLGSAHSNGTALRHGSGWQLIEGKWTSVTNMNNWANVPLGRIVHEGAIGLVDATHQYEENSSAYYYTGSAWVPFVATGVTKVHIITSVFDFSASGLADGDYGVLTPSGGSPIVLRYKAACTIAAGGTRAVWMTPTAYNGTPVLYAWTNGTENNATLTSQGWTLAIGAGCSLTATGGYQRLTAPGINPLSVSLAAMTGTITASTKVESIYECRASLPNGSACRAKQFYLADSVNGYSIGDSGQGGATGYGYRQSAAGAIANTPIRDVTNVRIPALTATPFVGIARDEGRAVFTSVSINGNAFADYRRNLGSIAANNFFVYVTSDVAAPVTMDYRGQVLTY